ncbi:MAG: hypothetical protein M1825_004829 [Sarcosagium campestre]|nr:MAG: hypothetical protein M1825_004829 [Sarcosagium campestre]
MAPRKRGHQELKSEEPIAAPSLLTRIRNMWQFANLVQFLFIFGNALRLGDDFDIEDLEQECLKTGHSEKLSHIGMVLLKFLSSHRGLTPELFDEYTRRQYQSKRPSANPFGDDEQPKRFDDFDVMAKIRVLWQMTQWTMIYPERLREKMPEDKDNDQTYWRVEPLGWDAQERTYFCLDDNRLYRQSEAPPPPAPPAKPKKNSKKAKAAARASKRKRQSPVDSETGTDAELMPHAIADVQEDGLGGMTWECIAVSAAEYRTFLDGIRRSKDADEKSLRERITADVLPVVEKLDEEQQRKAAKREKELLALEKLATAKRSSRLAGKASKQKEEEEAVAEERRRKAEVAAAQKDKKRRQDMEVERESRIVSREQRLKEREARRTQHEEELACLSEDSKKLAQGDSRLSARHLKAEIAKRRKALEQIAQETDWVFDCSGCGVHGDNHDDGRSSISCERCNVWQHTSCLGIRDQEAQRKDFQFVCALCKRREEDKAKAAKNPIMLDFRKLGSSMSPPSSNGLHSNVQVLVPSKKRKGVEEEVASPAKKRKANGHSTSDQQPASSSSSLPVQASERLADVINGVNPGFPHPSLSHPPMTNGDAHSGAVPPPPLFSTPVAPGYAQAHSSQNGRHVDGATTSHLNRPLTQDGPSSSPFSNAFSRPSTATQLAAASPTKQTPLATPPLASKDVARLSFPLAETSPASFNNGTHIYDEQQRGHSPVKRLSLSPTMSLPSPRLATISSNGPAGVSTLPPSRGGRSPTKQVPSSPPLPSLLSNGHPSTPRALPPAPKLSPSPQQKATMASPKKRDSLTPEYARWAGL